MSNYRLYTFVNFYLSSIQQGIQSAHIVSNLFVKYGEPKTEYEYRMSQTLWDWAEKDKTMIVLNGGTTFDIRQDFIKLSSIISRDQFDLPYDLFQEDHNALGARADGVMTGFGVVLPESIYDAIEVTQPRVQTLMPHSPPARFPLYKWGSGTGLDPVNLYYPGEPITELITLLKSKSLAR